MLGFRNKISVVGLIGHVKCRTSLILNIYQLHSCHKKIKNPMITNKNNLSIINYDYFFINN